MLHATRLMSYSCYMISDASHSTGLELYMWVDYLKFKNLLQHRALLFMFPRSNDNHEFGVVIPLTECCDECDQTTPTLC